MLFEFVSFAVVASFYNNKMAVSFFLFKLVFMSVRFTEKSFTLSPRLAAFKFISISKLANTRFTFFKPKKFAILFWRLKPAPAHIEFAERFMQFKQPKAFTLLTSSSAACEHISAPGFIISFILSEFLATAGAAFEFLAFPLKFVSAIV